MPFFPLTLSHGAAGAKTCIRCAPKKTQSRSDYFAGAKRHNIVSTVAKRLRFRCRFFPLTLSHGAEGAKTCIRCAKKNSREATICRREAPTTRRRRLLLAPKAPGAGKKTQSRSDYCRREAPTTRRRRLLLAPKAPVMRRRRLGNVIGAAGALLRGLQWRRRRPTLRSGAEQLVIHKCYIACVSLRGTQV